MSFDLSKLSNGLNVVTYSTTHVNSVSINIIVKIGSRRETDEEGGGGIPHFLEYIAFKGTKNKNAIQTAREFDATEQAILMHILLISREQTVLLY